MLQYFCRPGISRPHDAHTASFFALFGEEVLACAVAQLLEQNRGLDVGASHISQGRMAAR